MLVQLLRQFALGVWGIMPGNYSGITHIQGNEYAICDDKDRVDGLKILNLDIDSVSGKIQNAVLTEPKGMTGRRAAGVSTNRDCEGIAYYPEANTIFVSGEEDQRILEYSLDGIPTGRELEIPCEMQRDRISENLGFEALTYNQQTGLFWTTTESALPVDVKTKEDSIYKPLRLVAFDRTLKPVKTLSYRMDADEAKTSKSVWGRRAGIRVNGVPSMIALDDGRLIIMEREACMNRKAYASWVRIKLYLFDGVKKTLLTKFTTRLRLGKMNLSNYEGMCLGPKLKDGRQTIVMIADSQNGRGNRLYRLKDYIRIVVIPESIPEC